MTSVNLDLLDRFIEQEPCGKERIVKMVSSIQQGSATLEVFYSIEMLHFNLREKNYFNELRNCVKWS